MEPEGWLIAMAIVTLAILIAWPFLLMRRRNMHAYAGRWAEENGFELIKCEKRAFSPFWFKSNNQDIVLVELKDGDGVRRQAWLKLGGLFSGRAGGDVKCKWVE